MFSFIHFRTYLRALGITLFIVGVPFGMYMNFFVSNNNWSNIIMFIGVLLVVSYKNLSSFKFPSASKGFIGLIIYQLVCLFYMLLAEQSYPKYLLFHLFTIALVLSFMTTKLDNNLNIKLIIKFIWIASFACTIIFLFTIVTGIFDMQMNAFYTIDEGSILEPITMSNTCSINIICSLLLQKKYNWQNYLMVCFIFLDFYCIFHTGKRTFFFIGAVSLILYIWKYNVWKQIVSFKGVMFLVAICMAFSIVFIDNKEINEMASSMFERLLNGIIDMFTGSETSGGSAVARYEQKIALENYVTHYFNWYNYIVGAGYFTIHTDLPYLQSYVDMGIYGVFTFMYFTFFLPFKTILKAPTINYDLICAAFICLSSSLSIFNAGNPYSYTYWTQISLLLFVMANQLGMTEFYSEMQ